MFFTSKLLSALTQPLFWLALWRAAALLGDAAHPTTQHLAPRRLHGLGRRGDPR
jgi:hypothetical protein